MIAALVFGGLFLALFALFTVRIRQARARAALWRNLLLVGGAVAAFALIRKGGSHGA